MKITRSSLDIDAWRTTKHSVEVLGHRMTYVDRGSGDPVVLVHGNPTSSFLWRAVIGELADAHRCIAPDLIGMGDSDKLGSEHPGRYDFACHAEFLDAFLEVIELPAPVTLVLHDWGSGLGFDWARRHPERVRAVAYLEAIVRPIDSWEQWPDAARRFFQRLRSDEGESLILEHNAFVERILPASILGELSDAEMDEYRRPFRSPGEDRLPTLCWPRNIPIEGEPAGVVARVERYARWLSESTGLPKLFVNGDPGSILVGEQREFCRTWPDQTEVTVPGIHFLQEDSGAEIGRAVRDWLAGLSPR